LLKTEHIGSLLRPEALLAARKRFVAGEMDEAELRAVEDDAIDHALRAQEATGIDVVTDGEFRRSEFRGGIAAAVSGLAEEVYEGSWQSSEGEVRAQSRHWKVVAPLTVVSPIAADEASFLSGHASGPYKITLPAPSFMAMRSFSPADAVYSSRAELTEAFARITSAAAITLIERGVPYIQFDNPGYAAFLDENSRARLTASGRDPQAAFREMLAADAALLDEINAGRGGRDVTVGLHVCRGNNSSLWMNEGGYDPIAEELFTALPVDRFLLEFDDDRSGSFDCLQFMPRGKDAVLGLISTKTPAMETEEDLLRRLDEAALFLDPAQLAISPQCGFATHADGGNRLSADDQYRKLSVAAATAHRWFGG
jgi:5-methyltetrahydropteroyltriglutamate--homocysteine methyltransferase